jgi:hypothetical protein
VRFNKIERRLKSIQGRTIYVKLDNLAAMEVLPSCATALHGLGWALSV